MRILRFSRTAAVAFCSAGLLAIAGSTPAHAQVALVQQFSTLMSGHNVIVSGNYDSNRHVDGWLAVGGVATLDSAEINQRRIGDENTVAFRAYGGVSLVGNQSRVLSGSGMVPGSTLNLFPRNSGFVLTPGANSDANPQLAFNLATSVSTTLPADDFFSSRTPLFGQVSTGLASAATFNPTVSQEGKRFTFQGSVGEVRVFNLDVGLLNSNSELEVLAPLGSNVVINLTGIQPAGFTTQFNFVGANADTASRTLFNVASGNLTLDRTLWGSILAPNSSIFANSSANIDGLVFANNLTHRGEIHNVTFSAIPEPSTYALIVASLALAGTFVARRRKQASA
ncbi:collagen-binding domain-containing protein [Congregicoccus parvus]|uniref:collagen-binding domain-containing protein n=1 Tax=Congregicoccus parvus TaxID=3081749 RepID=UPI003FA5C8F9